MKRAEKEQLVSELKTQIEGATALYYTDFTGLNVKRMTELRRRLKKANVEYVVIKNTLALRAVNESGLVGERLKGPTGLVMAKDPVEAAKILRKHLTPFVSFREAGAEISPEGGLRGMMDATGYSPVDLELEEKLNQSLAELNLSVRATNCLESEGINTIRDLVTRSEDQLLQVRNFGETTLVEVRERLSLIGLRLGMKVSRSLAAR